MMKAPSPIMVTKASGVQEPFDLEKLRQSLQRSGAAKVVIDKILEEALQHLHPGVKTKEIYRKAFKSLRKSARPSAGRYKLKQAIMELGPDGFPFERLVAALLVHQGYKTKIGQVVQGRCVQHEIDVVAERKDLHVLVECKYHNQPDRISDVKVPLYIKARFDDIREQWERSHEQEASYDSGWIFTNTRFSGDAQQYGLCAGLQLVSWDYPDKGSLRNLVDESRLYPLTSITSLTKTEKQRLLRMGLVLCREILHSPHALEDAMVQPARFKGIYEEIEKLCN